jgi:LuxR family transcriptional regulator, maltose regulon positive regulatory protein
MLNDAAGQRVTTIIAQAGYGKTTLLYDWITSQNLTDRTAWVSLDSFDNSLQQFWAYVVCGLKKVAPELNFDYKNFHLDRSDPQNLAMLNPLFNELIEVSGDIILVLDNFQVITNKEILKSLSYLMDYQPRNLHIILASRSNPPLPLSRLSIQRNLVELTSSDLAFSLSEIKLFLASVIKLRLEPYLIMELFNSTEGWITGIQMAVQFLQSKNIKRPLQLKKQNNTQQLVEYLSEEIMRQQSEEVQTFLLKTSILSELSPAICDAVFERDDSKFLLEILQQQNLFITPIDQDRIWFRYHPQFAEALNFILKQKYPELIPTLNQKASVWSYKNGNPGRAIDYAIAAGDLDKATDILDENAMQAIIKFDQAGLIHWTSHFPDSLLRFRPNLGIYNALANLMVGQVDAVEPVLQIVENVLDGDDQHHIPDEDKDLFRWKIAVVRFIKELRFADKFDQTLFTQISGINPKSDAYLYGYTNHSLAGYYHRILDFDSADREYVEGCQYAQDHQIVHGFVFSLCGLAKIRKQQGRLKEAEWEYRRALKLLQPIAVPNPTGLALVKTGLGEIAILRNDPDGARKLFEEVIDQFDQIEPGFEWHEYLIILIRIAEYFLFLKNIQSARTYYLLAMQFWISKSKPSCMILPELVDVQKQIWIIGNEWEIGANGLKNRIEFLEKSNLIDLPEQVAYAHLLILLGETDHAFTSLNQARQAASRIGYTELLYEIQILTALVYYKSGQSELALNEIMRVIEACAPEEYTRIFFNHGAIIRELVAENRRRYLDEITDIAQVNITNFLEKLVSTSPFSAAAQSDLSKNTENDTGVSNNLSTREIEILELLAEGKSVKQISAELMISVNTTKTHVKNIYRKFGEHKGKLVIQRAIELGLVHAA